MIGVYVTVPVACFRKGLAREYLETESLPPPTTCYGFLLSLVGETRRARHAGCRVAPTLLSRPQTSVVLRTVWRCKDRNYYVDPNGKHHVVSTQKKTRDAFVKWVLAQGWPNPDFAIGQGAGTNARPDYQQLLTGPSAQEPFVPLVVWLDSSSEPAGGLALEVRVRGALLDPASVQRYGGLSLGESTHLVDEVNLVEGKTAERLINRTGLTFLLAERGRFTLPVWVDHVGSAGTRYATGNLEPGPVQRPPVERMPIIAPEKEGHP